MQSWPVPTALEGERLDRVIALITGLTRSDVNDILGAGRVAIGKRTVEQRSRKVRAGEVINLTGAIETGPEAPPAPDAAVEFAVVYADEDLIVVDKPAGLVVHPGAGNPAGTLVNGLLARYPELTELAGEDRVARPGIVHRLDKGTSGLLVVARTEEARESFTAQLADRSMSRVYAALALGSIDSDAGLIDAPLGRSDSDPTKIRVQTGGRAARTRYEVKRRFEAPVAATLVECRLETGRTHQIRVHLASIGHPVVGDDRYGGRRGSGWAPLPAGRPFLHAAGLGFNHPRSGQRVHFSSEMPVDLLTVLEGMTATG